MLTRCVQETRQTNLLPLAHLRSRYIQVKRSLEIYSPMREPRRRRAEWAWLERLLLMGVVDNGALRLQLGVVRMAARPEAGSRGVLEKVDRRAYLDDTLPLTANILTYRILQSHVVRKNKLNKRNYHFINLCSTCSGV